MKSWRTAKKIRAITARIFIIIQLHMGAERSASHLALIQHHLIYIQIMVETALFKQFFVASLLNDAAVL